MNWWGHFHTITAHKFLVMKYCFKVGLYRQGLLHDLSKYGPTEFLVGPSTIRATAVPMRSSGWKPVCPPPGSTTRGAISTIWSIGWIMPRKTTTG